MRIDNLLEIIARRIDIIQNLTLQATIRLRNNKIDQLGHLDILGCLIVHKIVVVQIATRVAEETTHRTRGRHRHVIQAATTFALMRVGDIYRVAH